MYELTEWLLSKRRGYRNRLLRRAAARLQKRMQIKKAMESLPG